MANYVLAHGAWHSGAELQPVASLNQATGHDVQTSTVKGYQPSDPKTVSLSEAIKSIVEYLGETGTQDTAPRIAIHGIRDFRSSLDFSVSSTLPGLMKLASHIRTG
jgi:hypothetical protein